MSEIKASRRDVPLFEVVEHIAGDLGQVALQYQELDHKEIGWDIAVDLGEGLGRAPAGNWEASLPVDGAIVQAWDRALADLIGAVRWAELRAKGRGPGSLFLEPISPGDFAELANNPIADMAPTVWCEGKLVLEFKDTNAIIVKCHPVGPPEVMWIDVCAESGEEVLGLWPSQSPDTNGTEDKGLVEVMPPPLGDTGPPEVGRNAAEKTPSRKVSLVARELKKLYPDGPTIKTIADLAKDLKISESTVKRAFSCNGWSRTRAKPATK
jgi:hypothetical protein